MNMKRILNYDYATWPCIVLAFIGLGVSSYLFYHAIGQSEVAACGGSTFFDCNHVLYSKWSKVFGISVALPAMVVYTGVLATSLAHKKLDRAFTRQILDYLANTAGIAAIWFISLQVFVIGKLCPYCLAAHICSLGIWLMLQFRSRSRGNRNLVTPFRFGIASTIALAAIQLNSEPPVTYSVKESGSTVVSPASTPVFSPLTSENKTAPKINEVSHTNAKGISAPQLIEDTIPALLFLFASRQPAIHSVLTSQAQEGNENVSDNSSRTLLFLGNSLKLRPNEWPLVGNKNADYVLVELFDYTCPHCRATGRTMTEVRNSYKGKLSVLSLPVPLNSNCNPSVRQNHHEHREACQIAKLAVAVWLAAPKKFATFHESLVQKKATPTYDGSYKLALTLVDKTKLDQILQSETPGKYINANVQVYGMAGGGQVPKLIFPNTTLIGKVESASVVRDLIKKNF